MAAGNRIDYEKPKWQKNRTQTISKPYALAKKRAGWVLFRSFLPSLRYRFYMPQSTGLLHCTAALSISALLGKLLFITPFTRSAAIVPAASVTFAILSLMRCRRNKTTFTAAIPAIAGLLLAFVSFTAYFLILLALAHSHSY